MATIDRQSGESTENLPSNVPMRTRQIRFFRTSRSPSIVVSTALFILCFAVLRQIHPSGILFYQGLAVGFVVTILHVSAEWSHGESSTGDIARHGMLIFMLNYAFLLTFPTNADRSFSLLMLQRISQAPRGLSEREINTYYITDFLKTGGLQQRLNEQKATGTVVENDGRYTLTSKGILVNQIALLTCRIFICTGRAEVYAGPASEPGDASLSGKK